MDTPICDFIKEYTKKQTVRFHMPGHKGKGFLGVENIDITEVQGADFLYNSNGIIAKSEENASLLFNSRRTFYSTGGSSQALKAMLYLAKTKSENKSNIVVCAKAAHQSFYSACALLNLMPYFIKQNMSNMFYNEQISVQTLEETLNDLSEPPLAVFITSPDYLGTMQNIEELSFICKKYNTVLLVDNAHGAYLKFLNMHPIELGADLCCDSAHKTLPALTGAAYLHIGKNAKYGYETSAKKALMLFGSSSPSYLVLQSLDYCNKILADNYSGKLKNCIEKINALKEKLENLGFNVLKSDDLRLVLNVNTIGYKGEETAELLREFNIEPEFYDEKFIVFMFTTENEESDFTKLVKACLSIKQKESINEKCAFSNKINQLAISPSQALLCRIKTVDVSNAKGKICADICISCPPAVPIVVSGEIINEDIIEKLKYYGISHIDIVE